LCCRNAAGGFFYETACGRNREKASRIFRNWYFQFDCPLLPQ
jgi:hypothetical protein